MDITSRIYWKLCPGLGCNVHCVWDLVVLYIVSGILLDIVSGIGLYIVSGIDRLFDGYFSLD